MSQTGRCPTCGSEVRVVGNTTLHYEPLKPAPPDAEKAAKNYLRENASDDPSHDEELFCAGAKWQREQDAKGNTTYGSRMECGHLHVYGFGTYCSICALEAARKEIADLREASRIVIKDEKGSRTLTPFDALGEILELTEQVEQQAEEIAEANKTVELHRENYLTVAKMRDALEAERDKFKAALESIANSCPGPGQQFELENRNIAREALGQSAGEVNDADNLWVRYAGASVYSLDNDSRNVERAMTEEQLIEVIEEWKFFWMNQKQNSQADYENYHSRAFGIDANMKYHLARLILKKLPSDKAGG